MENGVLVVYASKYGATAEIAEKIGDVLRQKGIEVNVSPVVGAGDPASYKAVILGSAAYIGQWRKEAVKFLNANEKSLAEKPVWIFSSGPTAEGDPIELVKGWRFPEKLKPVIDSIKPRDITVFHGVLDIDKMNFIEKFMINKVKAPLGDFRDWDSITSWANMIAGELSKND
ncbi:MAG: flavodoxin domain-containing protein [Dehalococcoidia bacterium]